MLKPEIHTIVRNLCLLIFIFSPGVFSLSQAKSLSSQPPLPEFTNTNPTQWFNSKPLKQSDLKGKVILIDFWTYCCWNCYRSFPWLNELESELSQEEFQVIGIHTPEFSHEKVAANVAKKIKEFELHHPVMMDNDFAYWKALNNRYWPAFYLVDKHGRLRFAHYGETHSGDQNADAIESEIRQLLKE